MAERATLSQSLHVVSRSAVYMVAVLLAVAVPNDAKAGQTHAVQTASPDFLPDGAYRTVRGLDTRARELIEQATQASPTVAALIAALGKTDVLVAAAVRAHELQHAKEIADAPDVRDQAAVRRLMNRIGRSIGDTFETTAAIRVGWQVWREVGVASSRR
jgi:hypothetical protein